MQTIMGLKIDVLATDGSPLGVTMATLAGDDPHQPGCGGAELAILTLCELWAKRGDDVTFYNNPRGFDKSPFHQSSIGDFNGSQDRDALIIFRSPNYQVDGAKGKKIWFSCDQYTVGNFKDFAPHVEKIVTISPFHAEYFKKTYGIENTTVIDLPVRTWEYENQAVAKIPKRCLFSSIPDRGLGELIRAWPNIVNTIPEASLVVTSDYRLWGVGAPMNNQYCAMMSNLKNVTMRGAIRRSELVQEQLKAQLLTYPGIYAELFCYAVAEAECAGALPITTRVGALPTTNEGWLVEPGEFANAVILALEMPMDEITQSVWRQNLLKRFGPERILSEWDKVFAS
jgi:glycosyltransferase involved in cell wall biosynthesis